MGQCLFLLQETHSAHSDIQLYFHSIPFHSIPLIFKNADQDPTTISVHFSWLPTCPLKGSRSQRAML